MAANINAEIKVDTTEITYINIDSFNRASRKNFQHCSSIKEFMEIVIPRLPDKNSKNILTNLDL